MHKLYIGNLNPSVSDGTLRGLLDEHGVVATNLLLKRTYAFVDCPDQENVDKAIDKLNGFNLLGSVMNVEPSMSKRRRTNKIQIRNVSPHVNTEDIKSLVGPYGPIQKCELVGAEGVVYVAFETPDQAQQAVAELNDIEFQGARIRVEFATYRTRRPFYRENENYSGMNNKNVQDLPLRMLVRSEFVGAIIGRGGQTIKKITTQSRARVDIHRRDNPMAQEIVVTIKGNPESCTNACKEILQVVQQESLALNKGEFPLKLLCPNHLCGRIIGKGGKVIEGIMKESEAHIVVSNVMDVNNYYVDRVVTITGSIDACSRGEALVSEKMRKFFEADAMANAQHMMYPNNMGGGMNMMPPGYNNYPGGPGGMRGPPYPPPPYMQQQGGGGAMYPPGGPGMFGPPPSPQPPQLTPEVTFLYIPEKSVGAVIGSKGTNIKNIMRLSKARIKILPNQNGEANGGPPVEKSPPYVTSGERKVIITGTAEAQWMAQFYIFDKVKTDGYNGNEEMHLKSEVMVPRAMVGRIIGKGGQNVREMQRVSGAIVKLPDAQAREGDEVTVQVNGHFYACISAQRRIRALMSNTQGGPPMNGSYPRRRLGPGREQNGN